jgi:chromosome segregation and condensation protein ScpB
VSFEKIARVLPAFQPQWDVHKGAEQLYAAYRTSGLSLEQLENGFQRINHIKALMREGVLGDDLRRREGAAALAAVA